jgi:hypothetical protein
VTATGGRPSLGVVGANYGWVGTMTGLRPPVTQLVGVNSNLGAVNIALPTHQVGDLLVVHGFSDGSTIMPGSPAGGSGTVPAWLDVPNCAQAGANGCSSHTIYAFATATNHTSGNWSNLQGLIAAVVRNALAASPFGGTAESGSTAAGSATAPAVTMSRTDGSSMLLHFMGHRSGIGFTAWDAAPAGYTQQAALVSSTGVCLITKDDTTSDGSVTQTMNGTFNNGYRGATVEVVYH